MGANPDPVHITDAEWRLWETCYGFIPGLRLGGIYANKSCYHNTVNANKSSWPGAYCIQLPLDLNAGPKDKARAIDLTMSDAEMRKRTTYLKQAAEHPYDDRLSCLREFIGTLDSVHVFCMIHDVEYGGWRYDYNRDSSHLWHIHGSFFTAYCAVWDARSGKPGLEAVASVLSGETWESWKARKGSMAKVIKVTEPVPAPGLGYPNDTIGANALFGSGGSGFFHLLDWDALTKYCNEWGIVIPADGVSWPAKTLEDARDRLGPFIGNNVSIIPGPAGPPGPATLVAHKHEVTAGETGDAIAET